MKSTTSSRVLKINESIYQAVFRYSYGSKQCFLDIGQFVVEIFSILFGNHSCNTLPKRHTWASIVLVVIPVQLYVEYAVVLQ